mmetsp:Transcript_11345/g.27557  ORF Transcript_11345/g.27557 Transcript_11345/m.27557 type:complete len:248 (+) Transcript_11345:1678-2421(+)
MGLRPAFSASVYGMISKAEAYALTQYACIPDNSLAYCARATDSSVSGAPPPAMRKRFLTSDLTTQRASCKDRSASSRTKLLDPRTRIDTVRPNLPGLPSPTGVAADTPKVFPVAFSMPPAGASTGGGAGSATGCCAPPMPVILTILWLPRDTSSTNSTVASLSAENESIPAIGTHPKERLINSTSSRSISVTHMIFVLAKKCSDKSVTASRRIDFCTRSTVHPEFLIFFTMLRRYCRSSRSIRSIAA